MSEAAELHERERQLAESQRIAHVGSFEWTPASKALVWSEELYRIFGVRPETFTPSFEAFLGQLHPEDRGRVAQVVSETWLTGRPWHLEERIVRPDGEVRTLESWGETVLDAEGRPAKVVGICQDITERKQAEERFRVRYAVTRVLAESATLEEAAPRIVETLCERLGWQVGSLWVVDPAAGVLRCAHLFCPAAAATQEFVELTRSLTFGPGIGLPGGVWTTGEAAWIPDVAADPGFLRARGAAAGGLHGACAFPLLIDGRVVGVIDFYSLQVRRPDGELLAMMADVGEQIGLFIARRQAEAAIRESQDRYRALFENSNDAIFIVDRRSRLLEANAAGLALFGYSKDEIAALRASDLYVGGSGLFSFLRRIARGGSVRDLDVTLRRRDGAHMECLVTATARCDRGGRVIGYEGIVRDVTAQRLADWGLRNLSAHLLQLQDEERRRLARELHDSTGQELAALAMNLSVASAGAARLGRRARKALEESQQLADRCTRSIRTLSYLLHPPLLDEMGLVSALRWLADGFQARSGIHLTLELSAELGRLGREMETTIFRIVQEALTNVHRHSGSPRATVRLAREGRTVVLEVDDEGHGIVPPAEERGVPGLGVGISGMRERVRQLGGWLEVVSGSAGTTVRATLPVREKG